MARLPSHGVTLGSLNEKEATLAEVVARLGFRKLTRSQEWSLRLELGFAVGKWISAGASGTERGITIQDLRSLLSRLAAALQESMTILEAVRGGFQHNLHVEAVSRIAQQLV